MSGYCGDVVDGGGGRPVKWGGDGGRGRRRRKYRKRKPLPRAQSERLVRLLCEAEIDVLELAAREGLSFSKMAAWSNDGLTQSTLLGMCRLNDIRAQLMVSRYRTLAAARLFDLSKDTSGGETARKACVDLLKLTLAAEVAGNGDGEEEVNRYTPISFTEMRALLAEVGRKEEVDAGGGEIGEEVVEVDVEVEVGECDEEGGA